MIAPIVLCGMLLLTAAPDGNPLFDALLRRRGDVRGARIEFPAPILTPGMSVADERAALVKLTGSDRALADFTRDSVTAPVIVKTHDVKAGDKGTIRRADVWFVVRASIDDIDPSRISPATPEGKPVEAANMRVSAERVDPSELTARRIEPETGKTRQEWFVHFTVRLLDRIHLEATDRVLAARTGDGWLIAQQTDPRFNVGKTALNRWHTMRRQGNEEIAGPDETYPGSASYVKIAALASVPGALLVEVHGAFFEPQAWFDGAPVLRSKITLVSQDRIRALRRELAKSKSRTGADDRSPSKVPAR